MADVIVVGGGAIGCAAAYELTHRGASVMIIERDSIGAHASGFSYGGLYPTMGAGIPGPVFPVAVAAMKRHRELAEELPALTGMNTGFREQPTLGLAVDKQGLAGLEREGRWQRSQEMHAEMLDRSQVLDIEQSVTPKVVGGLHQHSHCEVDSLELTRALAAAVENRGGSTLKATVEGLTDDGQRVTGVRLDSGEEVSAGAVIMATGPWGGAHKGLPQLPVRPVKGEILRLRPKGLPPRLHLTLGGYAVGPKPGGLVWAGATEEEAGFDDQPSARARHAIMEGAVRMVSSLAGADVTRHTACLRPVSADGLPIVGAVGSLDGLFAVNGGGKKGVLLCPALARMIAALVAGDPATAPIPAELSTVRFLDR